MTRKDKRIRMMDTAQICMLSSDNSELMRAFLTLRKDSDMFNRDDLKEMAEVGQRMKEPKIENLVGGWYPLTYIEDIMSILKKFNRLVDLEDAVMKIETAGKEKPLKLTFKWVEDEKTKEACFYLAPKVLEDEVK